MPPRYAYWTILAGGLPTSFRAALRDDLLPTLRRLQEKHPDAEMKWFARGKLWDSPEAARADRAQPREGKARNREWRPGGDHRDPRERFAKVKRERNLARRKTRFARRQERESAEPGHGSPPAGTTRPQRRTDRPRQGASGPRARASSRKREPRG